MPDSHITKTLVVAHTDKPARTQLAAELDLDGYTVHEANRTANAVEVLKRVQPDALLLGALENPAAAAKLLRALRAGRLERVPAALPVLTLGAGDALTQLRAYEDGSDHHLVDGAPYATLRAIIAAVLRRTGVACDVPASRQRLEAGDVVVDVMAREVTADGARIALTPREFDLLRTLASEPERVFTKAELLNIWGYPDGTHTRTLDSHACRLRRRLAANGRPGLVRAVWGVGYRLLP